MVVVNVNSCLRKTKSRMGGLYLWNGTFCLLFCCFWLGYCLCLRWDTCCDCSCFVSALPEVNRSIAGRKVSAPEPTVLDRTFSVRSRTTAAPRAPTKYFVAFLSCCLVSNQNEICVLCCVHAYTANRADFSPPEEHCANAKGRMHVFCVLLKLLPVSGVVVVLECPRVWSVLRTRSLHRHVAVGVVHKRRRVQGGGHVLVAEL